MAAAQGLNPLALGLWELVGSTAHLDLDAGTLAAVWRAKMIAMWFVLPLALLMFPLCLLGPVTNSMTAPGFCGENRRVLLVMHSKQDKTCKDGLGTPCRIADEGCSSVFCSRAARNCSFASLWDQLSADCRSSNVLQLCALAYITRN